MRTNIPTMEGLGMVMMQVRETAVHNGRQYNKVTRF